MLLFAGVVFFVVVGSCCFRFFFLNGRECNSKIYVSVVQCQENQRTSSQAAVKTSQVERSYGKLERQ